MGQKLVSPATYWRRRVVALAAALAVLTLPTWAVSQALGGSKATGQGSAGPYTGTHSRAGREHRHSLATETADLGRQPQATPQPSVTPPNASSSPSPAPVRQGCPSGTVVLTIRSAQPQYRTGQSAAFVVGAVSSGRKPCRIDLGSRFASVVVTSGGTPIWDSSSCLRGTGSQVVMLRRGVPASLRVTWDRRTSLSGCAGQGSSVRAGTYAAAAFDGQLRSHPTTFVLSGRAAAVR